MRITFLFVALVGLFSDVSAAHALRCGTRLIQEGDPRDRVRQLCGDPSEVSQRVEERFVRQAWQGARPSQIAPTSVSTAPTTPSTGASVSSVGAVRAQPFGVASVKVSVLVESWTYNFGPNRNMQRIVFFDGVVDHIEDLGRGYATPSTGNPSENDEAVPAAGSGSESTRAVPQRALIRTGDSRDRVIALWGEPTESSVRVVERAVAQRVDVGTVQGARVRVDVETWIYNFGPMRLMQRVVFEDGRVVSVDSVGMGY